jgi:PHP family Zn ribbon phosphoesterase
MDLHIHTCLSPCGDPSMTPEAIVSSALEAGMDAIGVTDHNSAGNAMAARSAGDAAGLPVLLGMEICSREEAHVLVFFDDERGLMAMQDSVFANLPGKNDPKHFGEQAVVDSKGNFLRFEERLLIGATGLGVEEVASIARGEGGVAIAAHVDRPSYSLIGQLGFVPEGLRLDAAEISPLFPRDSDPGEWIARFGGRGLPWVRFSDAHRLGEIGSASTVFEMGAPKVVELRLALRGTAGRGMVRE